MLKPRILFREPTLTPARIRAHRQIMINRKCNV